MKDITARSLHTGIGLIDSQHQTFFTLLKKIKSEGGENSQEELSYLIDELHLYTLYHFETEEHYFEQHGFKGLDEHKAKHKILVEKLEEFRLQNMTNSCVLAGQMVIFLEKWLIDHIQNTDMIDLKEVTQDS